MSEAKGADRLDVTSTDAMHWAECFCEQVEINGGIPPESDFLVGYFANFWAAIHDPMGRRIDTLEQQLAEAQKQLNKVELEAEEAMCAHMYLDDIDVPRHVNNRELSLVGRIMRTDREGEK